MALQLSFFVCVIKNITQFHVNFSTPTSAIVDLWCFTLIAAAITVSRSVYLCLELIIVIILVTAVAVIELTAITTAIK